MLRDFHKTTLKPKEIGTKLVMTEYELDRWFGNQLGIDIAQFPPYRPANVSKQAYEYLKKYASFNQPEGGVGAANPEGGAQEGGKVEGRIRKIRPKENMKKKDLTDQGENLSMNNNRSKDSQMNADYKVV